MQAAGTMPSPIMNGSSKPEDVLEAQLDYVVHQLGGTLLEDNRCVADSSEFLGCSVLNGLWKACNTAPASLENALMVLIIVRCAELGHGSLPQAYSNELAAAAQLYL